MKLARLICLIVFCWALCLRSSFAAALPLTELSLEELMNVEVTSVSKTPQVLSKIPAAVYVINNEDIHRSGMTTIPDLLRTVPGVQVGRIDSNIWGVSVRGFNDQFANKLLVLMDGRSVYTPLFSGTLWSQQDTEFEDIDRIEVVRGPGGTTWGANAVNGVINVITKSAKETQGFYAAGGYGSKEIGFGDVRYGGKIGDNFYYRLYEKFYNRDNSLDGEDNWEGGRLGGRADWDIDTVNHVTIQSDYYGNYGFRGDTIRHYIPPVETGPFTPGFDGPFDQLENINITERGFNLLGHYTHEFSADSDLSIQAYYDTGYLSWLSLISDASDTYDVDARYRFPVNLGVEQEFIIGAGYRYTTDRSHGSYEVSFDPANMDLQTVSWSAQDELRLIKDFMTVWVGSKFEHNDFTGFEYQPSVRLAIYPDPKNTIWGAITRAVRTPSRVDKGVVVHQVSGVDLGFPIGIGPLEGTVSGNEDFKSEDVIAYECGVKSQVTDQLNADLALFYNVYNHLRSGPLGDLQRDANTVFRLPVVLDNGETAETYGVETSVKYFLTKDVRFFGTYSYLHVRTHAPSDEVFSPALGPEVEETCAPNNQASVGTSLNMPWNTTFDAQLRYVGGLKALAIPDYVAVDMRLGWKPTKNWEVSLVGLDLFDAYHYEFNTPFGMDFLAINRRVGPSVYGKVEARY